MKEAGIRSEYEGFNHKLPRFDDINNEFEIVLIKNKKLLLRQVRRRMNEKVIFFCRIAEDLIYPTHQHIINSTEINNFSEKEKKDIKILYKTLIKFDRESLALDVNPSNEGDAEFINKLFNFWSDIKKSMSKIVKSMRESWDKETTIEKNDYFG